MSKLLLVMLVAIVVLGFVVLPERAPTTTRVAAGPTVTVREGVLDAGPGYVLALDSDGRVFGWGGYDANDGAKLLARSRRPRLVLAGSGYRRVAAGNRAIYVVDSESTLRRVALSAALGDELAIPVPIQATKRWRLGRETWGIGVGIDRDGALWWWSDDEVADQLAGRNPAAPFAQPQALMPGYRFVDACLQGPRLHAVDDQGRLWRSADLQRRGSSRRPLQGEDGMLTRLAADAELQRVACRENAGHVLALGRDGALWGYGSNSFGELGAGEQSLAPGCDVSDATQLLRIADGPFVAIAVAPQVSFAIAGDGALWGWGRNLEHELGTGDTRASSGPMALAHARTRIAVAATYRTGVALDENGVLQSWGSNAYGALGDGGIARTHDRPGDVLTDIRFGGSL